MAAQTPVPDCTRHPGMGFVYVCKSCEDQLLCMDCVTDSHNGHTLGKLTGYVADQEQEVQQFDEKLSKTDIPKTEGDIKESGLHTKSGRYQKMIEDTKRLRKKIGKLLVDGVDESYKPIPKCVVLHEFQTSFFYNTCQTCLTGDETWLSFLNSETIYRVDLKGKVNKRIKCLLKVSSISVSPTTGSMWICLRSDRSIREVITGGEIVTRFNVDNPPLSLSITNDDRVVVGMFGGIQLYTTDGRAVSAGAGDPCRQVAEHPHHMTSCTLTGDVAAVDNDGVSFDDYMAGKAPGNQPRVIVMDKHLNLKFYCKHMGTRKTYGSDNQSSKFFPYSVCFDRAGDVLVTEWVTKSILLIDRNTGHYMRTVYISDGPAPWCISLRDDRQLWVGHRDGKTTKVIEYR